MDEFDLASKLMAGNKQRKGPQAVKKYVIRPSELVRVKNDIKLKLTADIEFSMTQFSKPNKGFTNV